MTLTTTLAVFATHVAPVAAVAGLGYAMARAAWVSQAEARAINRFALQVAGPALIFGLFTSIPLREMAFGPALGYLAAELAVYALAFSLARFGAGRSRREAVMLGMVASFVNHVYFVLPVAENALGIGARGPILPVIVQDSLVIFVGSVILLDALATSRVRLASGVRTALRMPYIIATLAGLGINLAGIPLPEGVTAFARFLGAAASPAALFALGAVLSTVPLWGRDPLAWGITGLKLALHPLLVWLILGGAGLSAATQTPMLLTAAGPGGAMALALCLHYDVRPDTVLRVIVFTTLGALVSLSLLI